jgi:adenine-specific DNA-methyltransferase
VAPLTASQKLKEALRVAIHEAERLRLSSIQRLLFDPPKKGRITVKVINHFGDEVLTAFKTP